MDLINKNTPEGKGFRTFYQTVAATVVAFFYGLWQLPGVSDYVNGFIRTEGASLLVLLAVTVGLPAGVIAWWQNSRSK